MKKSNSKAVVERALYLCNASELLCYNKLRDKYCEIVLCPEPDYMGAAFGIKTLSVLEKEIHEIKQLSEKIYELQTLLEQYQNANTLLLELLKKANDFTNLTDKEINQKAEDLLECAMCFKDKTKGE